jgi:MFS family permease
LTTFSAKNKHVLLNRIAVKIAFFLNGFIYANWVSRLPRIQEYFHAHDGIIGIVLFSLSLGAVAAMPFTGWMIIKNGSRRITLFSLLGYCALVPMISLMPGIPALVILFIIMGIFTGMLDVAMNAQAVMVEQQYRKPIMTSFHALFSIGMALGAWCATVVTELQFSLLQHFSLVATASLVAVTWVGRNLIYDKPQARSETGPMLRIPNAALISIGIIAFCCMIGEGAMSDWTVNYMENITHASKTLAPVGLSAFATAMTLGRIFGDRVRIKLGDARLIIYGGVVAATGLVCSLTLLDPYIAISGFFLVGLGLSTIVPIAYSIAGNAQGLPSGVGIAMVTTIGYSGFLFGPPIIGFVAYFYNLRIGLAAVLILFIVMTILGLLRLKQK